MKIRFRSENIGIFDNSLAFEVVGTGQIITLICQGNCEVPRLSADPRNIFMRRVKTAPPTSIAPPSKKFIMSDNR